MTLGNAPGHIGRPGERLEDDRLLAGRARFVADVRLPGMVEAGFVRSTVPHGRILGIDTRAATALPAVLAVATAVDLAGVAPVPDLSRLAQPVAAFPLCRDRVRYVGAPLAVVVAADRYEVEDALELVEPRIEPLPGVATLDAALASTAERLYPAWPDNRLVHVEGRNPAVDEAFARLRAVGGTYTVQRQAPMPLETRGVVAEYVDDRLTVWTSTQFPHIARTMLARVLGLRESSIRVIAPDVGGGFGGKSEIYPEEYVVPWLARRLGRPVRWIEDRAEHMVAACHARDVRIEIEAAVHEDGTIEAVRGRVLHDVGSGEIYPYGFSPSLIAVGILTGPYRIPHQSFDVSCVVTNKTPSGAYRGFGQPEAVFAMERLLDKIAAELRVDAVELRRRLLVEPQELPYVTASGVRIDSGSHRDAFERGVKFAASREAAARRRLADVPEARVGVGIANHLHGSAASFQLTSGDWTAQDACDVRFDPDGGVTVAVGVSATGQGLLTMVATLSADLLGVPLERVRVLMGDTDTSPYGLGGWGSRSTVVVCGALHRAATEVRAKGIRVAAHLLDVPENEVHLDDEAGFTASGRSVGWPEVAHVALIRTSELPPGTEPGLNAHATFLPPHIQFEPDELGRVNACPTYTNTTHAAVVAVDVMTGETRVLDYGVFHDCGRLVNPTIVAGQLRGGVVQGIGGALSEEMRYDERGRPLTTTLAEYALPSASDVPTIDVEHLESLAPDIPLGVKGVGEAAIIGVPAAIASAIEDALAPISDEITSTPITAPRVLELVEGRRA